MKYFVLIDLLIVVIVIVCNFCCYCAIPDNTNNNSNNDKNRNNNNSNRSSNSSNYLHINNNENNGNTNDDNNDSGLQQKINNNNNLKLINKLPTILIALLIRNKAHTLPYFFSYLENLNYPKDRLALWIRSDHNEDNSIDMIHLWLNRTLKLYNYVDFKYNEYPLKYKNETSPTHWTKDRFSNLIQLKEEALDKANQLWADYIFYLDADVFLTNPNTLRYLTSKDLPIIAPMLLSEGLYSNFWCGMTDTYYYQRTDDYTKIYNYNKIDNHLVPMIHSAVLINLNYQNTNSLTFDKEKLIQTQYDIIMKSSLNDIKIYDGPIDDIIIFAISAKTLNIPLYINNEMNYGYVLMPLEIHDKLHHDLKQLVNIKLNIINDLNYDSIKINKEFKSYVFYPEKHKISLDHIYMINLERRKERWLKMEASFKELGLDVEYFPAVDGRNLNLTILRRLGIKFLNDYEDPYHHRQMTMGEIGCFLSHYYIWKKMIDLQQNEVLILEDDIRFEPYFYDKALNVLEQARNVIGNEWDLIYFGRKRLEDQEEPWVDGTTNLVHVGYSYWTLGYVLTLNGAKKLLNAKPLERLLPVDEFLPIMFNRHPNKTWVNEFSLRNLNAFSTAPLLLYPTHYTGDEGYISDTEDSEITPQSVAEAAAAAAAAAASYDDDDDSQHLQSNKNHKCAQNFRDSFLNLNQNNQHDNDNRRHNNNDNEFKNRLITAKSINKRDMGEL